MSRDYAYEAALAFANKLRRARGAAPLDELPKGHQTSLSYCPLARATEAQVDTNEIQMGDDGQWLQLPRDVARFVEKFDDGKYPELVK